MLSPFGVRKAGRMSSGGQECGRGQWHALFLLYFWCTKIRILFLVMTIARTPYGWAVLGTGLYPEQHFSKHSAHQTIKGCTSAERFITLANGACERGGNVLKTSVLENAPRRHSRRLSRFWGTSLFWEMSSFVRCTEYTHSEIWITWGLYPPPLFI